MYGWHERMETMFQTRSNYRYKDKQGLAIKG